MSRGAASNRGDSSQINSSLEEMNKKLEMLVNCLQQLQQQVTEVQGEIKVLKENQNKHMENLLKKLQDKPSPPSEAVSNLNKMKKSAKSYVEKRFKTFKFFDEGPGSKRDNQKNFMEGLVRVKKLPDNALHNAQIGNYITGKFARMRSDFAYWIRTSGIKLVYPTIDTKKFPAWKKRSIEDVNGWMAHMELHTIVDDLNADALKVAKDLLMKQANFAKTASNVAFVANVLNNMVKGDFLNSSDDREQYQNLKQQAETDIQQQQQQQQEQQQTSGSQTPGSRHVDLSEEQSELVPSGRPNKRSKVGPQSEVSDEEEDQE